MSDLAVIVGVLAFVYYTAAWAEGRFSRISARHPAPTGRNRFRISDYRRNRS